MGEIIFIKCHLQQKYLDVMVASLACAVTGLLTQKAVKRIRMTSQAQLATIHYISTSLFLFMTHFKNYFSRIRIDIV